MAIQAPNQFPEGTRRCIVRSSTHQELEAKVLELMLQGWVRDGNVAVAKPVAPDEPPYLAQAMIKHRMAGADSTAPTSPVSDG